MSKRLGWLGLAASAMESLGVGWAPSPSGGCRASIVFGAILLAIIFAAILIG